MLYSNVYLDSKRVSILIEVVLPTLPLLFNVYLDKDSKHTHFCQHINVAMVYLPCNVYLDSKRVSILIEAVPTLQMLYNVLLIKESKHTHRSSLAITRCAFPSMHHSERVSILIEAVLPTLLLFPFNAYLDSKRVSILIEAV